jgi:hypothetical protein
MRMSGSVCVIDSQQKPLLPTSAAYARTLVQQRKATLLPHPAVPLVQLTHAVPDPALRPMLLGIALQQRTATILIFTEASGDMPLLSLTLDLAASKVAARRVVALTALARTLGTLLPISQGAFLMPPPALDGRAFSDANHIIMPTLRADLPYSFVLLSHDATPMARYPLLNAFLGQMGVRPDEHTDIAAVYLSPQQPEPHQPIALPQAVRLRDNAYHTLSPGMVVQTHQQAGTVTGIIQAVEQDGMIQVRVPTRARTTRVSWSDRRVLPPLRGWRWEAQPIALLPVAQRKSDRKG